MIKCYIRQQMANNRIDDITQLIKLTGISRNSINKLYREDNIETINLKLLIKLCDCFKCKLSELIEYEK